MAYNKIEANGETLIDLTSDTVTADTLVSGRTAHLASGEKVTGTFIPVTGVKGNAETAYRTGNVNLTAANLGLDALGYYGIGGRTTNTTTKPWVLVAETTALNNNNAGITLLFDYTFTETNNATSTGTGILSVSVRTNANGAIITGRSYAKWLTKMNELNDDDVVVTYNNNTSLIQIWGKSDYSYKIFRVRPLSGSNRFNLFNISKWTFTTSVNTNMYESYPTGDDITVLTPTCDIQEPLSDYIELIPDDTYNRNTIAIGSDKNLRISEFKDDDTRELMFSDASESNGIQGHFASESTSGLAVTTLLLKAGGKSCGYLQGIKSEDNSIHLRLQNGLNVFMDMNSTDRSVKITNTSEGLNANKITIDTNGIHLVSGGTVFEVKSDGVYINGTKIGG